MANGYLLAAPDALIEQLPPLLESHGISCARTEATTVTHVRRTVDLVTFECRVDSANVELGVEKRHGRDGADIVLMPNRRIFFLKHNPSDTLAERINAILCENGADDSVVPPNMGFTHSRGFVD